MADSSKAGWVTVQHLESGGKKDQSAEVQKKVLIAEEAALKDLEGRKLQKRSSSFRKAQDGSSYKHYSAASGENNLLRGLPNGVCYNCKTAGHWARECPFAPFTSPHGSSQELRPHLSSATTTCNEQADFVSRLIDLDDWEIKPSIFQTINDAWGPFTVDCFACFYNSKLPRFFSRFWNPGHSRWMLLHRTGQIKLFVSSSSSIDSSSPKTFTFMQR
ncbi:uncharacterized protein LOC117300733 [Asterias rubens]|uniref:uncharacterized protein LOC117300733 n=1 Tax=Asterias rubens TaxID=7604 RepID=UPI0014552DF3|nr:uncharacterized protein LOC117300733 [Asterias rubens]